MIKELYNVGDKSYVRINKTKARNLFNNGKKILLLPEYITFGSMWKKPFQISKGQISAIGDSFDDHVDDFKYYNCNAEFGYGVRYFVNQKDL